MRLGLGMRLSDILKGGAAPVVPKSTLVDDLVSYWSLDEVSGTRADSVGDNDLTDNNTVGYDTGKNGNAASFVAGNFEDLSVDAFDLTDTDFTVSLWSNHNSTDTKVVIGRSNASTQGWMIYNAGTTWTLYFGTAAGATYSVGVASSHDANRWEHIVATYNKTTKAATLTINGGTPGTVTMSGNPPSSSELFNVGGTTTFFWDGLIDEVAIWSRVLTEDERAELYNSGAGRYYNATSEDFEE